MGVEIGRVLDDLPVGPSWSQHETETGKIVSVLQFGFRVTDVRSMRRIGNRQGGSDASF
jgi:hypothetical protein